mmetsp:Transcript_33875/g.95948  ORF Transcript_33875/g.95948 Transcript_33875/m.95948 type:complete len:273 (+) Transcript_33875:1280-2098(+)
MQLGVQASGVAAALSALDGPEAGFSLALAGAAASRRRRWVVLPEATAAAGSEGLKEERGMPAMLVPIEAGAAEPLACGAALPLATEAFGRLPGGATGRSASAADGRLTMSGLSLGGALAFAAVWRSCFLPGAADVVKEVAMGSAVAAAQLAAEGRATEVAAPPSGLRTADLVFEGEATRSNRSARACAASCGGGSSAAASPEERAALMRSSARESSSRAARSVGGAFTSPEASARDSAAGVWVAEESSRFAAEEGLGVCIAAFLAFRACCSS